MIILQVYFAILCLFTDLNYRLLSLFHSLFSSLSPLTPPPPFFALMFDEHFRLRLLNYNSFHDCFFWWGGCGGVISKLPKLEIKSWHCHCGPFTLRKPSALSYCPNWAFMQIYCSLLYNPKGFLQLNQTEMCCWCKIALNSVSCQRSQIVKYIFVVLYFYHFFCPYVSWKVTKTSVVLWHKAGHEMCLIPAAMLHPDHRTTEENVAEGCMDLILGDLPQHQVLKPECADYSRSEWVGNWERERWCLSVLSQSECLLVKSRQLLPI